VAVGARIDRGGSGFWAAGMLRGVNVAAQPERQGRTYLMPCLRPMDGFLGWTAKAFGRAAWAALLA